MSWTIRLKGCTRCGGDQSMERDTYGTYAMCLQCGATQDQPPQQEKERRQAWQGEQAGRPSPTSQRVFA